MTLNAKPRMDVVKREEKEAKLKAFISSHLLSENPNDAAAPWLLVARSQESPVIKALNALAPAISAAGHCVNTLLLSAASPAELGQHNIDFTGEIRFAFDPRLLEAHEQLYLDPNTSWIGDCMRRDPAKRDAFECFAAQCATTANWSHKTFERLWSKSEAGAPAAVSRPQAAEPQAPQVEGCPPQVPQTSALVVSTRH